MIEIIKERQAALQSQLERLQAEAVELRTQLQNNQSTILIVRGGITICDSFLSEDVPKLSDDLELSETRV